MADIFPKMAVGIQNAQIDFDRGRELRLQSFVSGFVAEYDAYSSQLIPSGISKIILGDLGRFLHHVTFMTWSHSICGTSQKHTKRISHTNHCSQNATNRATTTTKR